MVTVDAFGVDVPDKAFAQYHLDSVISFAGGKNEQGVRSDILDNINIIAAIQTTNSQARLIPITNTGCGERWDTMDGPFKQAPGEVARTKTEAEIYLR